jgi:cytoskeletal protein CcmA (bactofilin family)
MESPRAQSNPLAVALLLGIVVTGALTVLLFGGGVIEGLSDTAATERAAQEMTQFASETAAVALGGSDRRSIAFSATEGELTIEPEASWICVQNGSVDNRTLILPESDNETCDDDRTHMGSAVYDTGDGRVAYEGGGVWTTDTDGNSRMVSPPEFHYRGDTLTLPVVQIDGDVRAAGPQVQLLATAGETHHVDISNPLPENSSSVYVTVGSEYYEAWGEFMADRTDGKVVEFDHDDETVTVELVVPSPPEIDQAIYTSGTSDSAVDTDESLVDSYDSSESPPKYAPPNNNGSEGTVASDGGIDIEDDVEGNVYSVRQGGEIAVDAGDVNGSIHGQQNADLDTTTVSGDVVVEESVVADDTTIEGDVHTEDVADLDGTTVDGDVYADEGLVTDTDGGGVTIDGAVHAAGDSDVDSGTYAGPVHVDGKLAADESTFEDEVHVEGNGDFDTVEFDDNLHVDGDLTLAGDDGINKEVDGDVHVTGDADISESYIDDDVHVDGDLSCDSESYIDGTVHVGGDADATCGLTDNSPNVQEPAPSDAPSGTEDPEEPVLDPPAVEVPDDDEFDNDQIPDACRDSGDPDGEAIVIDDGRTCNLDPGTYDLSQIDVDSGTLDIKTENQEEVDLYVDGDVSIAESGTIQTGDSEHHNASELEINVYDEDASVDISSNVTGVVNAPDSTVTIDSGAHLHGAVIAEEASADGGGGVHYDEALSGMTVGNGQGDTPTVRYLHVTRNEMTVED